MKNQYVGDINDYKKYSMLRLLSGTGQIKTAICWALTTNDERRDGGSVAYLKEPQKWRKYDPFVFDLLKAEAIDNRVRDIEAVQRSNTLPNCLFYGKIILDDGTSRRFYFRGFSAFFRRADLIFFDPDNGLGVRSIAKGRKVYSKYIYAGVSSTLTAGSIL